MFKHILVSTDGSALSEVAIRQTADFAAATGARVTAFYAKPPYPDARFGRSGFIAPVTPEKFQQFEEREAARILGNSLTVCEQAGVACATLSTVSDTPAEAIIEAQRKSYELALKLAEHAQTPVKFLNLGGGFGIPYFPGERRLDLTGIAANLAEIQADAKTRLPEAQIVIELGRYLVGEAGIYVCRVLDKKISRNHCFLVTDGGLHHHLSASGNFGQVIRKNYPVTIGECMDQALSEPVSVVGPLCTPLDLLAEKMPLPECDRDNLVVIFQSGAYGASASPRGFLSHPDVVEILL